MTAGWYRMESSEPYGYEDEWREDYHDVGFGRCRVVFTPSVEADPEARYFDGRQWWSR